MLSSLTVSGDCVVGSVSGSFGELVASHSALRIRRKAASTLFLVCEEVVLMLTFNMA